MVRTRITAAGLDDLVGDLRGLDARVRDLAPLAGRVARVLAESNAAGAAAGTDTDGVPYAPVKDVTYPLTRAFTGRERGGGPPLAPAGASSRVATDFTTAVVQAGPGHFYVSGDWPNLPWVQYHSTGYTSRWGNPVPSRDPIGVRPEAWARIGDELTAFADGLVAGLGGS